MAIFTDQQLFDKTANILVEHLGVQEDEITLKTNIVDDLCADSLDIVELTMAFEEKFNIEIPEDDVETRTVQDIVDYLSRKLADKGKSLTEPVKFTNCPAGLFLHNNVLCMKTQYTSNAGIQDAYIVKTGEYFWGGTTNISARSKLMVTPIDYLEVEIKNAN